MRLFEKLKLLEIEGKFSIQRSMLPMNERMRTDKVLSYNFNEFEKIEEFSDLYRISKLLYFLPFELNMYFTTLSL